MKKTIRLIICVLILTSCKDKEEQKNENKTIEKSNSVIEDSIKETNVVDEKKNINHLFVANGGSVLYMKNGERRSQARFDTDGDFVTELLKVAGRDGTYKSFDNYLIENNDTLNFFDDSGKIESDWLILNGNEITNNQQVVSFTTPKNQKSQDIEFITSTNLIFFSPKVKTFKDENSEEANDYFTTMDDWNYYSSELRDYFKKLNVNSIYSKKRYLEFEVENNKKIIIDTKSKINNYSPQCLLYKKGKIPIISYMIIDDNNLDDVKNYLK